MGEKIEVPFSKVKLYLGIGGSILFVILSYWLFINANQDAAHSAPLLMKGIGILGILFFGATGSNGLVKLIDKNPGLTIDSKGITDNSNAMSIGLIEWKDISDIKMKQVMQTRFLLITVNNPEFYIAKAKGSIKALSMKMNLKMYGTPVTITSSTLEYDFEKLEALLKSEFEKHKNSK